MDSIHILEIIYLKSRNLILTFYTHERMPLELEERELVYNCIE